VREFFATSRCDRIHDPGRCFETLREDESILSSRAIGVNEKKFREESFCSRLVRVRRDGPGARETRARELCRLQTTRRRCAESRPASEVFDWSAGNDEVADAEIRTRFTGDKRDERTPGCAVQFSRGAATKEKRWGAAAIQFGLLANRRREPAGIRSIPAIGTAFREVRPAKAFRRTKCPARSERLRRVVRLHSFEAATASHPVAPSSPRDGPERPG